jgi:branched-chain amino acid transport system substrate-binding protein
MGGTSRRVAVILAVGLLLSACASRLTDQQVLDANGTTATTSATIQADDSPDTTVAGDPTAATVPVGGTTSGGNTGSGSTGGSGTTGTTGGPTAERLTTPGQTGPIIIGSVGNYSGPAGAALGTVPRAVQVWVAWVNAHGGLFGRQVQLIVQDDGGDPARYAAAVRDLVENRHVVAFVGQGASISNLGGKSYLEANQVPVIGNDCTSLNWEKSHDYFSQCPTIAATAGSGLKGAFRLGEGRRFGYVFCSEACTEQDPTIAAGAKASGAELVYREQISLTQVDFTSQCRNAMAAGVETMFVGADPNTLSRWARSCDRQGFHPQYFQATITVTPDTLSLPGLADAYLMMPTFAFEANSGPAYEEFRAAVKRFTDSPPSAGLSLGWTAAKMFENVATRAVRASGEVTSKSLYAAMHTVKDETLGGLSVPLTFTGDLPANAPCVFLMKGDGKGGWTTPFGTGPFCG